MSWPGGEFLIRHRESGLVITLKEGKLGLCPQGKGQSGNSHRDACSCSLWHCVEDESMWLGFYNVTSGTFIGHNGGWWWDWRFVAEAKHHDQWSGSVPGRIQMVVIFFW